MDGSWWPSVSSVTWPLLGEARVRAGDRRVTSFWDETKTGLLTCSVYHYNPQNTGCLPHLIWTSHRRSPCNRSTPIQYILELHGERLWDILEDTLALGWLSVFGTSRHPSSALELTGGVFLVSEFGIGKFWPEVTVRVFCFLCCLNVALCSLI